MNFESHSSAWRSPLTSVQAVRAQLDGAWQAILAQMLEAHTESVAVAEWARQRVVDIESSSEAAAQRTRLASEIELGQLRSQIDRLQTELQHQRVREVPPEALQDGGAGAEVIALREELQACRAERDELARQLDIEKFKHARLIGAVQSIQQTHPAVALFVPVVNAAPCTHDEGTALDPPAEVDAAAVSDDPTVALPNVTDRAGAAAPQLVTAAPPPDHLISALTFDPTDYVQQLLGDIKAVYDADALSGLSADELVARLTANLAYAHTVFAGRADVDVSTTSNAFDDQLNALHDGADATFGRHLGVAIYEYRRDYADLRGCAA